MRVNGIMREARLLGNGGASCIHTYVASFSVFFARILKVLVRAHAVLLSLGIHAHFPQASHPLRPV